jgi:iron complex outermembrane receptor protein
VVRIPNPADGTVTVGFRILAAEVETFARTTWRTALEYDLAERALLHASFETGFKSGGFFFSNDDQSFQPEYIGALTLGLKSRLLENRLQANVELFDWRYRDQQVSKISVDSRGATNLRTQNVGRAAIRGIATSLEFVPRSNTRLGADLEVLRAVYDLYRYRTPLSAGRPQSGCAVTQASQEFLVDCSGRRSPYSPERTLVFQAAQEIPLRSASLVAQVRPRYQSATLAGLDFLPQQEQPDYWLLDASLMLVSDTHRRSVTLFAQNLTDRTIISNTFVVPFSTFVVGTLRPPRTIGVRVSTRF